MNTTTTIPSSEDPPSSPPSSIFSSFRRYLSSISPHKTLRNLRLLILALAFSTLILDAITLSFEINVMNLDLAQKQVATQAALLFTPDLLAMTMALVLMLQDCFGCCRTRRPYHEQEYEGSPAYQEEEDIGGNQQQLRQEQKETALQGQVQEGVNQHRGKSRSRSSRTSRRGTARELHQDGSRSRSRSNSIEGYRSGDGIEYQHYDGGISLNNSNNNNNNTHHGPMVLAQEHRSPKLAGVQVQQQQHQQQQQQQRQQQHSYNPREQLRYETSVVSNAIGTQQLNRISPSSAGLEPTAAARPEPLDLTKRASIPLSSSTTLSTPSPNPTTTTTTTTTSSAAVTMTNDNNSIHTKASTSSSTQCRNKQRRKKRRLYYYIAFRILFSCILAVLALYWPASKRKPPLGYLPNLRESQNHHQGDDSVPHSNNNMNNNGGGDTQHNSTITPTIVARAFLSYESFKEPALTSPTSTSIRSIKSKRQMSSYGDDLQGSPIKDDQHSDNLESAASGHYSNSGSGTGTVGHIPPNLRPGGPGSGGYGSHWCSLEEAFGDNQSAVVYCQVKDVRPVMTYVWASLILLELCAAYFAGDFSIAGTRHQKENQLVAVDDDVNDLESRAVAVVSPAENHSGMEDQEQQPPWTTVGQGQTQAQEQDHQLGHSGISITVTEADAAGVGYSGSWDQGQTLRGRTGPQIDR